MSEHVSAVLMPVERHAAVSPVSAELLRYDAAERSKLPWNELIRLAGANVRGVGADGRSMAMREIDRQLHGIAIDDCDKYVAFNPWLEPRDVQSLDDLNYVESEGEWQRESDGSNDAHRRRNTGMVAGALAASVACTTTLAGVPYVLSETANALDGAPVLQATAVSMGMIAGLGAIVSSGIAANRVARNGIVDKTISLKKAEHPVKRAQMAIEDPEQAGVVVPNRKLEIRLTKERAERLGIVDEKGDMRDINLLLPGVNVAWYGRSKKRPNVTAVRMDIEFGTMFKGFVLRHESSEEMRQAWISTYDFQARQVGVLTTEYMAAKSAVIRAVDDRAEINGGGSMQRVAQNILEQSEDMIVNHVCAIAMVEHERRLRVGLAALERLSPKEFLADKATPMTEMRQRALRDVQKLDPSLASTVATIEGVADLFQRAEAGSYLTNPAMLAKTYDNVYAQRFVR